MVIAKNYLDITPVIKKILFRDENKMMDSASRKVKAGHNNNKGIYMYLNYYQFHILIARTHDQVSNFKELDDEFFTTLSKHKKNLSFVGFYNDQDMTFTPMEMIYHMPNAELGIYVRKRIIKQFKDKGLEISPKAMTRTQDYTSFIIM